MSSLRGRRSWLTAGLVSSLLCVLSVTTSAAVTVSPLPQWSRAAPTSSPAAQYGSVMALDRTGHLILFGGTETWEWLGSSWTQLHPAHQPSGRYFSAMVYDSATGKSVMFGGRDSVTNALLADTWIWTGSDWKLKAPSVSPPARYIHTMAYDAAERRVVMFGGAGTNQTTLGDTWEWDGTTWAQRQSVISPGARYHAVMAYDRLRSRVVLFGGVPDNLAGPLDDTWTWDGSTWANANPAQRPPAIDGAAMAFDPHLGAAILFGGEGNESPASTWLWDGVTWTAPTMNPVPAGRKYEALAYDSTTGTIVMFGGLSAALTTLDDTWSL